MSEGPLVQPAGIYGCLFRATPARSYQQFSSFNLAYLFYDFVAVAELNHCIDLHSEGAYAKPIMLNAFRRTKDVGVAIDPEDTVSKADREMSPEVIEGMFAEKTSADAYTIELLRLNKEAREAVWRHEYFLRELRVSQGIDPGQPFSIPAEYVDLQHELLLARNRGVVSLQDFFYKNALKGRGYIVDDGKIYSSSSAGSNDLLRPTMTAGRMALNVDDEQSPAVRTGEEFRTFCLMLKAVPFPTDMSDREFKEFRDSKLVRKSIGAFRKLAGDLVQGQAPTRYVVDELVSKYEDYKNETVRSGIKTVVGNVKFVVSTLAGFAEDVVKLRLENLGRRPFEVVEYFVDRRYRDLSSIESPFYFLIQKDQSLL